MDNMDEIKILFDWEDDDPIVSELNDFKGSRDDVKVLKAGKEYDLIFYSAKALISEINAWEETKSFDFIISHGYLILQDQLDNESIRKRIHELVAAGRLFK